MPIKYSKDTFIKKVLESFPENEDKFDYSNSVYTNLSGLWQYSCKICGNEITKQRASDHLRGNGCRVCSNKVFMTRDVLIQRSREKFGDKFNFDKTPEFKGNKTLVVLNCPEHGDFEISPRNHLKSGNGCPQCYRYDAKEILEAFYKHPINSNCTLPYLDQELLGKSVRRMITVRCSIHGESKKELAKVISGISCKKCVDASLVKDVEVFRTQFEQTFKGKGFTVDYSTYSMSSGEITVTCPQHGDWKTTPNRLVNGNKAKGCPKCNVSKLSPQTITLAERHKEAYLKQQSGIYVLKLVFGDTPCYKIGLAKDLNQRLTKLSWESGADIEVLFYEKLDKYNAIMEEQTLLQNRGDLQYHSLTSFAGCNELLTLSDEQASDLIEYLDGMVRRVKQT